MLYVPISSSRQVAENQIMECMGPQCAAQLLDWLKARAACSPRDDEAKTPPEAARQALLWTLVPYDDEAPAIRSADELAGALEHLEYAVFRRYNNQLTRAERARLDNTIDNALFKIDRFLLQTAAAEVSRHADQIVALRQAVRDGRQQAERRLYQARRAELKLAQLDSLTPESFEEFVAELFEMLGYEVERLGGSGDEGADLKLRRDDGLLAVVQCKYHKRSVVGSPALQRFLGTIHHTRSHKGYFVTTTTFSLSAEKFAAANPIELVDGPRLVELVNDALGPKTARDAEAALF
jgi:restriction system protein